MKKILLFLIVSINIFCVNVKSNTADSGIKDKEVLRLAKIELNEEDYEKIYDLIEKDKLKEVMYILKNNKTIDRIGFLFYILDSDNMKFTKEILKILDNKEKLTALGYFFRDNDKELINLVFENKIDINGYNNEDKRLWEILIYDYVGKDDFLEKMNFLISKGLDISGKSMYGDTILTRIFSSNELDKEFVKAIFEIKGIDKLINVENKDKEKPLQVAFSNYGIDKEIVELLISKGVDIQSKDSEGRGIIFQALQTGDKEIVNLFLNLGENVNAVDNNSRNLLSYAVVNGKPEIVKLLIEKGANVNQADKEGKIPIHHLLMDVWQYEEKEEILKILLEDKNTDLGIQDFEGRTLIDYAESYERYMLDTIMERMLEVNSSLLKETVIKFVQFGDTESLNYLAKSSYNFDKKTLDELLDYAEQDKSGEALIFLLKRGANINYFNENYGNYIFELLDFMEYEEPRALSKLLDLGLNYKQLNDKGQNILTYAIDIGENEVAKMIMDKKSNVSWKDNKGETPLIVAARKNDFDMIDYIFSKGGNINETDNQQRNALMVAMDERQYDSRYSDIDAKYFLDKGIGINHKDGMGLNLLSYAAFEGSLDLVKKLVKMGIETETIDKFGNKPLLYARGKEKFQYLLNLTQNVDYKGSEGEKYMKNAIAYSDYEVFSLLVGKGVQLKAEYIDFAVENMEFYNKKIIEILLKNIKNGFNKKELFTRALYNNDIETLGTLIARGYNINTKNGEGKTPMDIANSEELYLAKEFLDKKLKASKKK